MPDRLPAGVLPEVHFRDPSSACIRCDSCDGFPCLVRGKADTETICIAPALAYPNVTLLTGARAVRLEADAAGRWPAPGL